MHVVPFSSLIGQFGLHMLSMHKGRSQRLRRQQLILSIYLSYCHRYVKFSTENDHKWRDPSRYLQLRVVICVERLETYSYCCPRGVKDSCNLTTKMGNLTWLALYLAVHDSQRTCMAMLDGETVIGYIFKELGVLDPGHLRGTVLTAHCSLLGMVRGTCVRPSTSRIGRSNCLPRALLGR